MDTLPQLNAASRSAAGADGLIGSRWRSVLKLAAMVAVITIHISGYNAVEPTARSSVGGRLAIALNSGSLFCVPVFVMVSGSLLLDPRRFRAEGYLRRRVLRIVPALLFWHLAYAVFVVGYLDRPLSVGDAIELTLHGELFTALYYFWIILGLSLVVPVLIPFVAANRSVAGAAIGACAAPVLTVIAGAQWPDRPGWTHLAWTWWFFYLGYFLLGWWLTTVRISARVLAGASAACIVLWALLYTAWLNPGAPALARALYPASYYSLGVHLFAVAVFVVGRGAVEHLAGVPVPERADRWLRSLGDATLGVFVLHLMVIEVLIDGPVLGGGPVSSSSFELLARIAVVTIVTFAIVVPLRRVPIVRRVL